MELKRAISLTATALHTYTYTYNIHARAKHRLCLQSPPGTQQDRQEGKEPLGMPHAAAQTLGVSAGE